MEKRPQKYMIKCHVYLLQVNVLASSACVIVNHFEYTL